MPKIQAGNITMNYDQQGSGELGRHDMVTSTRFADRLKNSIKDSELHIFEDCSHAPLYENVTAFNEKTLGFLCKHAG
jgi:pimeloyl-ACP methyl ester carboxylesterase